VTTLTSTACQTFGTTGFFISPPKYLEEGYIVKSATYTFTAAQSVGDVIQMVNVAKGCQLIDLIIQPTMSSGQGSFTFGVGDNVNTTRYGTSLSTSGNGVVRLNQGSGYSYSADNVIQITMQTVTSATTSATLRLTAMFSFDQNQKG
jgi:hypothetical protein